MVSTHVTIVNTGIGGTHTILGINFNPFTMDVPKQARAILP